MYLTELPLLLRLKTPPWAVSSAAAAALNDAAASTALVQEVAYPQTKLMGDNANLAVKLGSSLSTDLGLAPYGEKLNVSDISETGSALNHASLPDSKAPCFPGQGPTESQSYGGARELLWSDLKIGDVIGEGSFGYVKRGVWRGMDVAIKTLKQSIMKVSYHQLIFVFFRQRSNRWFS
jgi:hypothetical protein